MSNSYFQFKQFRVEQAKAAMKVSTDACVFGAWTPLNDSVQQVLDIGTGTGLLSLMLAQRKPGLRIDAIELDEQAAKQAAENFAGSPWHSTLSIICGDVKDLTLSRKYDLIICNPPFFQNSLLGDNDQRNIARHTLSLTFEDLLAVFKRYVAKDGYASVLLPTSAQKYWEDLLQKNEWYITERLIIFPRASVAANRVVCVCRHGIVDKTIDRTLVIYKESAGYTDDFQQLLSPFYLHL